MKKEKEEVLVVRENRAEIGISKSQCTLSLSRQWQTFVHSESTIAGSTFLVGQHKSETTAIK